MNMRLEPRMPRFVLELLIQSGPEQRRGRGQEKAHLRRCAPAQGSQTMPADEPQPAVSNVWKYYWVAGVPQHHRTCL